MNNNNNICISIIIPAYNEERSILKCLDQTLKFCEEVKWDAEIIVAEDGSTDNTVNIVQEFQKKDSRIKIISFKHRLGKGGSIKNAMLKATKQYVCFMDADLSAYPSEFKRLLEYIDDYDVVIGSRLLRGNLSSIERPFHRTLFSLLYSKFFHFLFRMPIRDPQCGFKLFKKEILQKLFQEINVSGFAFDSEVVVKAYILGLKIKEVPIIWSHDNASKVNVIHQIKAMGNDLVSIWYESHLLWLQNKNVYPQKKGSIFGRLVFSLLFIFKKYN
jgi:glycosyltransferase involved in cell wall biosynthesis